MTVRYLIRCAKNAYTYKMACDLEREYGLTKLSITTEPGYFFADVPDHTLIQLQLDARVFSASDISEY